MKELDLTRRDFIAASAAPVVVTGSGCIEEEAPGKLDTFYFESDLQEVPVDLDGEDIYVNLSSAVEGTELEENRIEYQEPGASAWNVLGAEEVDGAESAIQESYTTDKPGEYRFRAVAETRENRYVSETEVVEFVEEIESDLF